jgi:hypothetical protein
MFRSLLIAALIASVSAFAPARIARSNSATVKMFDPAVFENAVKGFEKSYPAAYKKGWGPTAKAERWNGRHAMFGWIALLFTGYAKSHGMIPNGDVALDLKEWGTLAYIYGGSVSNERAIAIVGHLHLLFVSVCAAIAPLDKQDRLYYAPGEKPEAAAGLIPKASPGLTASAELLNGRIAMLGITALLVVSTVYQIPILDVISVGTGGKIF